MYCDVLLGRLLLHGVCHLAGETHDDDEQHRSMMQASGGGVVKAMICD